MSETAQRLVFVQDALRNVCSEALRRSFQARQLGEGDEFTLLCILHQVNTPMGYKSKVDSRSLFGANKNIIRDAIAKKLEEYNNNPILTEIHNLCQTHKVKFRVKVTAAASPKIVSLIAAEKLGATWIVLDREMKKNRSYFLEHMSCGISNIKRAGYVKKLRGPKGTGTSRAESWNWEESMKEIDSYGLVGDEPEITKEIDSYQVVGSEDDNQRITPIN